MEVFTHKIAVHPKILRESDAVSMDVRIRKVRTGEYYDPSSKTLVEDDGSLDLDTLWVPMLPFWDTLDIFEIDIDFLEEPVGDFVFEYRTYDGADYHEDGYERHLFGTGMSEEKPAVSVLHGTVRNVAGEAMAGQRVDVYLNKSGYFVHKSGLVGTSVSALTDSTGYFELELIRGLEVTVSVPSIGFTVRGKVPDESQTLLTATCLLGV